MPATCEPAAALARLGGDAVLYGEAVAAFLADDAGLLIRLGAAIESGDAAAVHAASHALKGLAGMCGAMGVVQSATELESQGLLRELNESRQSFARLQGRLLQAAIELRPYCH